MSNIIKADVVRLRIANSLELTFILKQLLSSILNLHLTLLTSNLLAGLKVGQMTRTIWVTWVTFLVGQAGLICKLNYLDVTRIFIRSHVL